MTVPELLAAVAEAGYAVELEAAGPKLRPLSASAALPPQLLAGLKSSRRAVVVHLMLARAAERGRPLFWLAPGEAPVGRMGIAKRGVVPDDAAWLTCEGDKAWTLLPRAIL